jgi:NAD(P)-dependent dehydrogenase (short-subunit alcohol dehydrogenase family)
VGERLKNKIAIVVGAGTRGEGIGNGKASAVLYAREGARVFCIDRDETAAKATSDTIRSEGGIAEPFAADITSATDCEAAVKACNKLYGKANILHNNVGIADGKDVIDLSAEDWERIFAVNVRGMSLMCRYAIPDMISSGGGSIVNISSIASIRPMSGATYVTTKGAVNAFTLYLARRYGRYNIRANCLLLGYMDTPLVRGVWQDEKIKETNLRQVPMRRFGTPWEGAAAAVFLASDEASYITGQLITVDGGLTLNV